VYGAEKAWAVLVVLRGRQTQTCRIQAIIAPVVVSGLGYEVIAKSRAQRVSIHHLILAVFHCSSESLTRVNYACEQMGIERLEPELPPEPISSTQLH
jgi:hypothetical protein